MKAKLKRHSRSALSVLLSLCMLVSCITVGMIGTDAAQTLDAIGASLDEASVGAAVDDGESVGDPSSVTIGYDWDGSWKTKSLSKNSAWEVTFSTAKTIQFYFQDGSTFYKYDSSQQMPYDSTNQNEFRGHKNGSSNLSFSAKAATYVVVYTGTNNNDLLYFKFYRKQSTYSITKTTDGNGTLSGASSAAKDASVTLTANPNRGYQFASATVKDSSGNNVSSTVSGNNISFTMPAKAVTANATFTTATSRTVTANKVTEGQGTIKLTLKSGSTVVGSASADNTLGATLTAYDGETLTVTTSPSAGYKLTKITINGTDYTSAQTITISGNVTVSAEFVPGASLPNDYTATLGSSITENSNLFSNIKATFFDYYTDHEISGGWYNGIDAATDAWIGGIPSNDKRNPYKTLNSALSEYASTNSIQYPFYFGSFYWDNVYHDPGYYHSSSTYNGHIINDSNQLGSNDNTKALPGLAGSSLTSGMINYASYSGTTYNDNGVPMVLFDKNWLSSRGNESTSSDTIVLRYRDTNWTETNDWSYNSCRVCAAFRTNSDIYFVEMTKNASTHEFTCTIPSGYNDTTHTLYFVRFESGKNPPANGSYASNYTWPSHNNEAAIAYNKNSHTYRTTGWNSVQLIYNGPLASFVNSGFPVRKTTHDGATYYEFDSSRDSKDTIYFDGLNFNDLEHSNPIIQYTNESSKVQKAGYNSGSGNQEGFFPFDRWDKDKRTDVSWDTKPYGKDLALGMKLEIKFTLGHNASGKLGYILKDGCDGTSDSHYTAQKFDFTGDDDLWVYVDDNLILDLGGDHSKTVGQINFADSSSTSTYQGTISQKNTNNTLTSDTNKAFTLDTDKKVHTMTIYYMERGMHESNLKFGFSMSPLENEFSVENEVDTTGLNRGLARQFSDTFNITNNSYNSDGTTPNDHSKSKNYDYYKWNNSTSKYVKQSGTYTSGSSGQFNLTASQTGATPDLKQYADFNNKLKVGDVLNVVEASQTGYKYNTSYQILDEEYLVDGQPDLIKQGNGATTGKFTFKTALPNSDPNIDVTNLRVKYNNVLKTQTLDVTKALQDGYASPDRFTVQLGLVMKNGSTVTQTFNTARLVYKSSEDGFVDEHELDSSGRTTISRGETIRFEGIPEGAVATVTEIDKPGYAFVSMGHSASSNTYSTSTKSATVTLNNHDVVKITNKKLYDLTISKEVTGGSSSDYFPVVVKKYSGGSYVQITSSNYNTYSYDVATVKTQSNYDADDDDWYFDTDKNRFMVKAGKSFTIKGSSTGDKFTVAEYTGDISGYTYTRTDVTPLSAVDVDDDVVADSTNKLYGYENITFATDDINVNISNAVYVQPTYNLTVTKTVTGGDSTEYFPIYVQYKYAGGSSYEPFVDENVGNFISGTIPTSRTGNPDWYFDGTNDCFMLKAGESFTIPNNNIGDKFIVVEDTGNIPGYTYSDKAISGASASDYGTSDDLRGYRDITINNSDVTVTITNEVVIPTYTLKLTKTTDSDYDYTTAFKVRVQKKVGSDYVDLYTGGGDSTPYHGLSGVDHNNSSVTRNALPYSSGGSTQFYYYPVHKGDVLDIPDIIDGDQIRVIEVDPDTSYYNYGSTTLSNVTNATTRSAYNTAGVGKGIDFTFDADDVTNGENLTVTINNVSVKQTVRVYKRTNFNINDGSTFQIHVKWLPYNKGGSYINKEGGVINTDAHVTSTSTTVPTIVAEGKYSLQKDEYVEFTNVPYGSTFQVEETAYGDSNVTQEQRFTFDKLVVDGHEYTENVSLQTFEITKDTNFFVWNKIFKNDVKIKKIIDGRVTGEAHDTETEHTFSIGILRNGQGSASYNTTDDSVTYYIANAAGTEGSGVTVTEFPFTVTLKEDEEVRLHGIYSGSFFTVRETSVGFGYQYNSIEFTNVVDNDPTIEGLPNPTIDSSARSITFQTRNLGLTGSAGILFKNEKRPTIKYRITYNYPSRTQFIPTKTKLYGDQQYFVEDTISGDDENYDTYFANGKITKALVQAVAPFETNFMIDLSLNPDNITIGSPVTSGSETIYYATATFTGGETTRKHVNFKLPYNYTVENHTYGKKLFQATNQNYLGDDVDNWSETDSEYPYGVPYQDNMTAWETETYVDTDGKTKERNVYFFTEAPATLNNNGTTMNFLYWSVRSVNESTGQYEEVARCYDTRFNYVIFDDYEITPVYDGFASSLGYDTSGNTESTTAKFATINLLAFSRNQWNSNVWNGTQVKGNGTLSTNLEGRDTVYVDFDVAFEYNNVKLKNHKTIETGILIENCGKLDVDAHPLNFNDNDVIVSDGKTNYQLDYEYYADKYSANKTAMEAQIKEYLKGNIDADAYQAYVEGLYGSDFTDDMYDGSFEMLKTYNTNGSINNMNRSEIGIGNHVRVINDDGSVDTVGEWSIDDVKKNSVFRAYTYIKDAENNIILSEPVYFTVYNTAVLGGQV